MATVTVNVQANTGDATQDINNLDKALDGANTSAEDLSASLAKQEARIKTLDGAINLIGGSVEILAGGLALSGALTEEQAEKFQTAAIGAIAFADGTKRVLDGYKSLNEGLVAYGGIAGGATKATKALNTAIKANPYVAAATAIVAITSALYLYISAQEDEEAQLESGNKVYERRLELLQQTNRQYFNAEEQLGILEEGAKARNRTILEEAEAEKERAKAAQDRAEADLRAVEAAIRSGRTTVEESQAQVDVLKLSRDEAEKYYKQIVAAEKLYVKTQGDAATKLKEQKDAARDAKLEYEGFLQTLQQTTDEIVESLGLFRLDNDLDKPLEELEEIFDDLGDTIFFTKEQLAEFNRATEVNEDQSYEARRARLVAYYDDLIKQAESNSHQQLQLEQAKNKSLEKFDNESLDKRTKLAKAFASDQAKATQQSLDAVAGLFTALADVTGEGNEEAFEKSKKFKIAEVVTSSIQAAFQAFGAAQQFGPILGPILGAAQVAAIAVASNKAIQDIKSSQFDGGGGTPSLNVSGGGVPAGFTPQGLGGGSQTLIAGVPAVTPTQPVRAYVVTGDVTSGQEAEAQLQTRRQFP